MVRCCVTVVSLVVLAAAGCADTGLKHVDRQETSTTSSAPVRVGASGMSLTLDSRPWWPVGMNAYQLATDWTVNEGCGAEVGLDDYFSRLPPHSLTRMNVFSSFAVNKATGALDFGPLDAVFGAAERHHQPLIAVLTGDEGACEHAHYKDSDWYSGGWRTDVSGGEPMPFGQWLDTAVTRWHGSPAVAGWTVVGEPEPSDCGTADCDWRHRRCPSGSTEMLRTFVDDTGGRIHELDPGTLVWGGRASGGQCGSAGVDWTTVAQSPGIDVVEYHDYDPESDFPGDPRDGLQQRIDRARSVNKPLVVSELGLRAGSCLPLQQRKDILARAIAVQREHGTAGALFWSFVPDPRLAECTLDIGPDDPLWSLVGAAP